MNINSREIFADKKDLINRLGFEILRKNLCYQNVKIVEI